MGIVSSIDQLQNDPYILSLIQNAISNIFTIESSYHEEVQTTELISSNVNQFAGNEFKGWVEGLNGSKFTLTQNSKVSTIVQTAYASNLLSRNNGVPVVNLITYDMMGITTENATDSEIPNYTDAKYILQHIMQTPLTDENTAEFDFDLQAIKYTSSLTTTEFEDIINKALNDYVLLCVELTEEQYTGKTDTELQNYINNNKSTFDKYVKNLQSIYSSVKKESDTINNKYDEYVDMLDTFSTNKSTAFELSDNIVSRDLYNELKDRYNDLYNQYQESIDAEVKKRNKQYVYDDFIRERDFDNALKDITADVRNADKDELNTKISQFVKDMLSKLAETYTTRAKQSVTDYNNFANSSLVQNDKDTENYDGYKTLLDKVNDDEVANFVWNTYIVDLLNGFIDEPRKSLGMQMLNFYYSIKYDNTYKSLLSAVETFCKNCFTILSDASFSSSIVDDYNKIINKLVEIAGWNGYDFMTLIRNTAQFVYKFKVLDDAYRTEIMERVKEIEKFESTNKTLYTAWKNVYNRWEVSFYDLSRNAIGAEFRNICDKYINCLTMENAEKLMEQQEKEGDKFNADKAISEWINYCKLSDVYNTIANSYKDELSKKVENVQKLVTNISTNVNISVVNTAFNKAINVEMYGNKNVLANISQNNELQTMISVTFENIVKHVETLPDAVEAIKNGKDDTANQANQPATPSSPTTPTKPNDIDEDKSKDEDDKNDKNNDKLMGMKKEYAISLIVVISIVIVASVAGIVIAVYIRNRKNNEREERIKQFGGYLCERVE